MFQTPTPPNNNKFWWLRVVLAIMAICGYVLLGAHCWQNAQKHLLMGDLTTLCLMALSFPALIVEVLVHRGYVNRYVKYLNESDAVRRWRQWRRKEDDDIVH